MSQKGTRGERSNSNDDSSSEKDETSKVYGFYSLDYNQGQVVRAPCGSALGRGGRRVEDAGQSSQRKRCTGLATCKRRRGDVLMQLKQEVVDAVIGLPRHHKRREERPIYCGGRQSGYILYSRGCNRRTYLDPDSWISKDRTWTARKSWLVCFTKRVGAKETTAEGKEMEMDYWRH